MALAVNTGEPVVGSVVEVFSRGCYVRFGTSLIAVGDIPAGPLHLVCTGGRKDLVGGEIAMIAGTELRWGAEILDLAGVARWDPTLPPATQVPTLLTHLALLPDGCPDDLAVVWTQVCAAVLGDNSLRDAARLLEGRGSGLTPTGDDVLAGLLLVDALHRRSDEDHHERLTVAQNAQTTDLSRHFLRWAARGQSIAPVHQVIDSAALGLADAVTMAADRVRLIGASSGRAILAGLRLGATSLIDRLAGEPSEKRVG